MSRHLDYRDLEPVERRVALMRAAGASQAAIGRFLDCDQVTVDSILGRPRVSRYLIALESTYARGIEESVVDLSNAIEKEATRAFEIERTVMERLYDQRESIRAQLGAAATAQDILDRAGKRAPTRTVADIRHSIDPEALRHVASVLRETEAIDITPRRENGSATIEDVNNFHEAGH